MAILRLSISEFEHNMKRDWELLRRKYKKKKIFLFILISNYLGKHKPKFVSLFFPTEERQKKRFETFLLVPEAVFFSFYDSFSTLSTFRWFGWNQSFDESNDLCTKLQIKRIWIDRLVGFNDMVFTAIMLWIHNSSEPNSKASFTVKLVELSVQLHSTFFA